MSGFEDRLVVYQGRLMPLGEVAYREARKKMEGRYKEQERELIRRAFPKLPENFEIFYVHKSVWYIADRPPVRLELFKMPTADPSVFIVFMAAYVTWEGGRTDVFIRKDEKSGACFFWMGESK